MSRGPRASCRHAATEDDGFSLIEVVVALGVFLVVMTAVLPLIVGGLRGTARAGQVTEQKGVVEAQLERMRNLPWHVAPNAGQFIDVLDRYFPNLTAPTVTVNATTCAGLPAAGWKGYVTTTARCPYEPASPGTFYRTVETIDPAGPGSYLLVTDVQFLSSTATGSSGYGPTPAAMPTVYNAAAQGSDTPVSQQVGVTVTAFDLRLPTPTPFTDYTQIAENVRSPQRVQTVAQTAAIELTGVRHLPGDPDQVGDTVGVTVGTLDLNGFLAKLGSASGRLSAVEARWSSDDPKGLQSGFLTATAAAPAGDLRLHVPSHRQGPVAPSARPAPP